ncbi:DNA-directed RNA polymerase subunit beta [Lactiplantibacillus plantarum]|nr:DNA-directed RNA polymerase subunit beta [Lactiplantibacillus plantarum]
MNDKDFDLNIVNRFFRHDYHDRGLMKWQGFYLSDHTAALNQQKVHDQQQYPAKP